MAGVDELDLEAARLEDLKERDPVDSGGFHDHGVDSALLEPVSQTVQIGGEALEAAHGLRIAVLGNRHVVLGGSDIDAGGVEVHSLEARGNPVPRATLFLFRPAPGLIDSFIEYTSLELGCARAGWVEAEHL